MSTSSHHSRSLSNNRWRVSSLVQEERANRRSSSYSRKRVVSSQDAYTYALRVAFLAYLLQPRARRVQHVPAPKQLHRSSTSVTDLVKDFSLIRDSKSTKFPHGFMKELDKRLTGVLVGKEKMPEYNDPLVKSTFAGFLNEFKDPKFRKTMEENRRVEDLLLIFFSNATKIMQRGKAPDDDSWRLMVDRHVALFIRLISSTLRNHDWTRDRPELLSRLTTMEKKLLMHDQDLAAASQRNGGSGGSTVEVEVPRSYEVKDMPLVLVVSRIFSVPYDTVQQDINARKDTWTEKAALQDLKAYQTNLSLNTRQTLSPDDFDTEEAYEAWKRGETQDLSQMMLAIIQSSPELAKSSGGALPQFKPDRSSIIDSGYSEMSRKMSEASETGSYVIDQPVDVASLNLNDVPSPTEDGSTPYTYIPSEPRAFYRAIVKQALTYDLQDDGLDPTSPTGDTQAMKLLSRDSAELLSEIGLRWRVPQFSRLVLFLDVVKEKYQQTEISLETLDDAFTFVKQPPLENNKKGNRSSIMMLQQTTMFDHTKWTIHDCMLKQQILSALHEDLLRELFQLMLFCYDSKPPTLGPVMFVLNNHIYEDPLFNGTPEELDEYSDKLKDALAKRAAEVYSEILAKNIPDTKDEWEFFHVIELGKAVIKLCEKIQKRYRKNPEIMGVNPLNVLVAEILPSYAADARDLVAKIMEFSQQKGEDVPIPDGFDLYKELVEIRRIHADALPDRPFAFHIEDQLQDFVWRWIDMTNQNLVGWVENAVKQDDFQVRIDFPDQIPTDDERHSVSVVDIFRSFNQSIEQIVNLNWDDDLQYAKFMTATSKAVGGALSRYCEMLETMFSKEMERLTPEQEAAARQTRQEKWLQMAKDTWNNKDKIEPYQFLPESLVKLNNIEYATQQLDKLEREVNVDACAEVIQKHTPPSNQRQKMTKYVFTIKIIEAEDIKACDMNGLSDPYVVLGDEYQKRLAKTRVVYGSLNPRWEETVDITTSGPLNIIATIWDWDTLGDHDCVGRTSLKLDPSHFRDFMPREYWLDLDTQGRLLLRVSMEGEKDDIQFYFGKAFRTLKRSERDMTRKITDKLSSYIHYCLSRRALKALLNRGVTVSAVASYFRARPPSVQQAPSQADVMNALQPLFGYFNDNFALMKETLTDSAMVMVMSRLWKEVLAVLESLLVPPLSDKPSQQRPLTQQELDIVFKWLQLLFDFFHAVDEDTGVASGVPLDILKSPKYHDLQNLNFFYFESSENLIRTSEAMAAASLQRQQEKNARNNRLSSPAYLGGPPAGHSFGGAAGLVGTPTRKHKTVMLSRNLGTMKRAKEEKRKEAQAEPSDDIILRILRMRPEAERYLRDRSRQKERLAAAAAAEMIVKQSLMASNSRR
ncbi:c2 domain containing protein [Diplodia corticola]|uniref:C2 domain containing protein n=1 Tax=Diplodia corticola TaxID=236234 RepID=A0A1J9RT49_9PEZI|nr:c2 domain containing protein [Diplodia corticola]OJD35723.1 c2 domain containing protein [Diplodia corticola]